MSAVSFPQGSIWSDSFELAIEQWFYNPSPFYFYTEYGENSVDADNSQNEVWFSDDQSLLDGAPRDLHRLEPRDGNHGGRCHL
jgi:hypothetical protein